MPHKIPKAIWILEHPATHILAASYLSTACLLGLFLSIVTNSENILVALVFLPLAPLIVLLLAVLVMPVIVYGAFAFGLTFSLLIERKMFSRTQLTAGIIVAAIAAAMPLVLRNFFQAHRVLPPDLVIIAFCILQLYLAATCIVAIRHQSKTVAQSPNLMPCASGRSSE